MLFQDARCFNESGSRLLVRERCRRILLAVIARYRCYVILLFKLLLLLMVQFGRLLLIALLLELIGLNFELLVVRLLEMVLLKLEVLGRRDDGLSNVSWIGTDRTAETAAVFQCSALIWVRREIISQILWSNANVLWIKAIKTDSCYISWILVAFVFNLKGRAQ